MSEEINKTIIDGKPLAIPVGATQMFFTISK